MTYNIRAGHDLDRTSNLSRIAALIDSVRSDLVLLQEVDRNTARSGRVDQAAVLARLTAMHAVFAPAMEYDGGEYGIAILSRWPVRASYVVPLDIPQPAELAEPYEPRALLHVMAGTPLGIVHIVNTHVDHRADPRFRQLQLMQLMAYIARAVPQDAVLVVGGDLNAGPESAEVGALRLALDDAWLRCGAGPGLTFRSDDPDRRIDYVLLARATCRTARVLERTYSDHRPVVVDVRR